MEEYYFEVATSNSKVLCVGPITREEAEIACEEGTFCDGFGYYLFVADANEPRKAIRVLAKLISDEAVTDLGALLKFGKMQAA